MCIACSLYLIVILNLILMGGPHSNMPGIDKGLSHPGLNNDPLSLYAPVCTKCTSFILCKMPIYLNVYIYNNDIRPGNTYIQSNPIQLITFYNIFGIHK